MLPGPSRHGEYRKFNQGQASWCDSKIFAVYISDCLFVCLLDCLLDCRPRHTTARVTLGAFLFNINFQSCCSFHATQAIDDLTNHRHSMIRAGKHLLQTIDQQRFLQDSLRQAPSRCLAMLGPSPKLISCMLLSQSTL